MPEEIQITQEQWEAMLAKQVAKQAAKTPTRATISAAKPMREKSFTCQHYFALGQSDADSLYKSRSPETYVVLHFYMREGETFQGLQNDAKNYQQMFQHCKFIVHDHPWNEPCKPAPKFNKCKEI